MICIDLKKIIKTFQMILTLKLEFESQIKVFFDDPFESQIKKIFLELIVEENLLQVDTCPETTTNEVMLAR